jgi:hypothetical protein
MSAAGLATLLQLIDRVGVGWCYTIFAGLSACCFPLCLAEMRWGIGWRKRRERKMMDSREKGWGKARHIKNI